MDMLRTGLVTQVNDDGVWAEIASLAPHFEFGPMEIGPFEISPGDRVLVGQVSGSIEDMVLIGPLMLNYTSPIASNSRFIYYYENQAARTADVNLVPVSGLATWLDDEQRLDIYTDEGTPGWVAYFGIRNSILGLPAGTQIGMGVTTPTAGVDIVTASGTAGLLAGYVTGDANRRVFLDTNGTITWGNGTAAGDSYIKRVSAGGVRINSRLGIGNDPDATHVLYISSAPLTGSAVYLKQSNSGSSTALLHMEAPNSNNPIIGLLLTGDTFDRYRMTGDGAQAWGPGTGGRDTNLYRLTSASLATDSAFTVGGVLTANAALVASSTLAVTGTTQLTGNVTTSGTIQLGSTASTTVQAFDTVATSGTLSSASFVNALTSVTAPLLATVGIAFVAPPSGKVMVFVTAGTFDGTAGQSTLTDFEIKTGTVVGSGTSFRASDENTASQVLSGVANQTGRAVINAMVSGLTPGASYNAAITYRTTSSSTGSWNRRRITVAPAF